MSAPQCISQLGKESRIFTPTSLQILIPSKESGRLRKLESTSSRSGDHRVENTLAKIWREIVQKNKRQKRLLQCIELAKERIKTRMSIADLAKRHNLTEHKVRRDIETVIFLARSSMFEKTPSTKSTWLNYS